MVGTTGPVEYPYVTNLGRTTSLVGNAIVENETLYADINIINKELIDQVNGVVFRTTCSATINEGVVDVPIELYNIYATPKSEDALNLEDNETTI